MEDIVKQAEAVMYDLLKPELRDGVPVPRNFRDRGPKAVTTSQIRKFLTAVNTVTNKVNIYKVKENKTELSDELAAEVKYLKIKVVYQAGRDNQGDLVSTFIQKAKLISWIDGIGHSIAKYEEFAKYIEALVAYHKFYGGKDK